MYLLTPDTTSPQQAIAATTTRSKKLRQKLRSQVGKAIADYNLISSGDKVMVCLSGGKDSFAMLEILRDLQAHAPIDFSLVGVHLDQKQPRHNTEVIAQFCRNRDIAFDCIEQDTYSIVTRIIPEGKTMCGLCSRLRRGNLYNHATKIKATKIALGHHSNDLLETFFLNLFFGGSIKTMPVKLLSKYDHLVIRPMAYCQEAEIARFAKLQEYPIIPCNLCGSQQNLQRQQIKTMLREWQKEYPRRAQSMFKALSNIKPSHMLDKNIFDFSQLGSQVDKQSNHNPTTLSERTLGHLD